MFKKYFYRITSKFWAMFIFSTRKFKNDDYKNSNLSQKFLKFNNKYYLNKIKNSKIKLKGEHILLLLPHCIQNYDCPFKVTSYIEKCVKCGKCPVGDIVKLVDKYKINVKIATGGTLARKVIKEIRPKIVIAVACERDLVSGIIDSFPMPVYGIFNRRENGPCYNTLIDIQEIEKVLDLLIN